ncbi:MAG: hypothetical protein AAFZ18_11840 [Myxococcota bacterium]
MACSLLISSLLAAVPPPTARSIQDRIDAASPGSVLELPRGRIQGVLRVDKPLTVRGARKGRTTFESEGKKAALMVMAPKGTEVVLEHLTFTTAQKALSNRGAGVMISGPGRVVLRDVIMRRTIQGRCLGSAVSFRGPLDAHFERVKIEDHRCFTAGALIVDPGVSLTVVDSLLADNSGELAGAVLVTGGRLRVESTVFRGNRFERGKDGHHLVLSGRSEGKVELIAVDLDSDARHSVAIDSKTVELRVERMTWKDLDPRP